MASVIRLDRILGGKIGDMEMVAASVQLENGRVGVAGPLKAGEREVHVLNTPAAVTDDVVLVAVSELMTESYKGLADFTIPANKPIRAYHLHVGDVITVTDDAIDGATVVGQYVTPQVGSYKLKAVADLAANPKVAFYVESKDETIDYAGSAATVLRVVRA
jgi:hypothetical protein